MATLLDLYIQYSKFKFFRPGSKPIGAFHSTESAFSFLFAFVSLCNYFLFNMKLLISFILKSMCTFSQNLNHKLSEKFRKLAYNLVFALKKNALLVYAVKNMYVITYSALFR